MWLSGSSGRRDNSNESKLAKFAFGRCYARVELLTVGVLTRAGQQEVGLHSPAASYYDIRRGWRVAQISVQPHRMGRGYTIRE